MNYRSYFSDEGNDYSLCRVPVGCSDFSLRFYSYDDDTLGDANLTKFNLTKEDFDYKVLSITTSCIYIKLYY